MSTSRSSDDRRNLEKAKQRVTGLLLKYADVTVSLAISRHHGNTRFRTEARFAASSSESCGDSETVAQDEPAAMASRIRAVVNSASKSAVEMFNSSGFGFVQVELTRSGSFVAHDQVFVRDHYLGE